MSGTPGNDTLTGTSGDDTLEGLAGDDFLEGLEGNDSLDGGDDNDSLSGGDGNDTLIGGAGNDTLFGNGGSDVQIGGDGDDYYRVGALGDVIVENDNEGIDTVSIHAQVLQAPGYNYVISDNIEIIHIEADDLAHHLSVTANDLDNLITGDTHNNGIDGAFGNDTIEGGEGNDTLYGQQGDDELYGDEGNDFLLAGDGDDSLSGGDGNDTLIGGNGNDTLFGNAGTDRQIGGAGDDLYRVGALGDVIIENVGEGTDTALIHPSVLQAAGYNYVVGNNVEIIIMEADDFAHHLGVTANSLDNLITGDTHNNRIDGAVGNDTISGGDGNDTLIGGKGDDELNGDDGNDSLNGGDGNDTLRGGSGIDTMVGGKGNDFYGVGTPSDIVTEKNNEGIDTLVINPANDPGSVFFALSNYVENIIIRDFDEITPVGYNINANGNALNNEILGNTGNNILNGLDGNDILDGGAGNDTLSGGKGNDTLRGGPGADSLIGGAGDDRMGIGSAADVVVENANEGFDTVVMNPGSGAPGFSYIMGANIEAVEMIGDDQQDMDAIGNVLNNRMTGNDGVNNLDGDAGNDTILGGAGNDVLIGGIGNDSLDGGGDDDNVEGGAGLDTLIGGAGLDTLVGGADNDTYIVEDAGDTVTEVVGEGIDTVKTTVTYTLAAEVENLELLAGAGNIWGYGNALNNNIKGNEGNNVLIGDAGNDTLLGGDGHDSLDGETGNDSMVGGKGDDYYWMDSLSDVVVENAKEGWDTVILNLATDPAGATYTLGNNFEGLAFLDYDMVTPAGWNLNGIGNAMANLMLGNSGNNMLDGKDGDNVIDGGAGDDTLIGGKGNDVLIGRLGIDSMVGGAGYDEYVVGSLDDIVVETANGGIDLVIVDPESGAPAFTYTMGTYIENLALNGVDDQDLGAIGNALANHIQGNAGANEINGGDGNDTILGGAGSDSIGGENGNDSLNGGDDDDVIGGGAGNDTIDGGTGSDDMAGNAGNDLYYVDDANDNIHEGETGGIDTVRASVSYTLGANVSSAERYVENLELLAGAGDIDGTGNDLANNIKGNEGANVLEGGAGIDTMAGGLGNDTYVVNLIQSGAGSKAVAKLEDVVTESGAGADTIVLEGTVAGLTKATTLTIAANLENLNASATGSTWLNITGNSAANTIIGNAADNRIDGSSGNDSIQSGDGNDTLIGGAGVDTLVGGIGHDTYVVDNIGDVITEASGQGGDTVQASVSYILSANIEYLQLTGTGSINGTGNSDDNRLTGNSGKNRLEGMQGNDILDGGAGIDTMVGGEGNDTYIVDNKSDSIIELSGEGTDTVFSNLTYELGANLEDLTLMGNKAINGIGNSEANLLTGNDGNNSLSGGGGDDTLIGGIGKDTLVGGAGDDYFHIDNLADLDDLIVELAGGGTDTIVSNLDETIDLDDFPEIENLIFYTSTIGRGNALNNVITGNGLSNGLYGEAGDDTLNGGGGGDILYGGEGNDRLNAGTSNNNSLYGEEGADTFVLSSFANAVADFEIGVDKLELNSSIYGGNTISDSNFYSSPNAFAFNSSIRFFFDQTSNNLYYDSDGSGGSAATYITTMYFSDGEDHNIELSDFANVGGFGINNFYKVTDPSNVISEAPASGTDTVYSTVDWTLDANFEHLTLIGTAQSATGNDLANEIYGNAAANTIAGADGNDTLDGKLGNDTLTGGAGNDLFLFSTSRSAQNVDTIADFTIGQDKIGLDEDVYISSHWSGTLDANFFVSSSSGAQDADDRIVYDPTTGGIYYDFDGSGTAGAAVLFAQVQAGLALSNTDFVYANM